jgi:hypothetical protein
VGLEAGRHGLAEQLRTINRRARTGAALLHEEDDTGEEGEATEQPTAQPKPKTSAANPAPNPQGKVKLMDGERVVFTEETNPQNYLKLIASGEVDGTMLEALEGLCEAAKETPLSGWRGADGYERQRATAFIH